MSPPTPVTPVIRRLVVLGATGDLAGRYLLPALAHLSAAGELPDDLTVTGSGTSELSDEEYRERAAERLREHAPDVPGSAVDDVLARLAFVPGDAGPSAGEPTVMTWWAAWGSNPEPAD